MRSSPERTSPCIRDDVTMVDECKKGTPTSNTHVNNDFQKSMFHKFENVNSIVTSMCTFTMLTELCISKSQREIWQLNRWNSYGDRRAIFSTFTRGLYATTHGFKRWRHCSRALLLTEKANMGPTWGHLGPVGPMLAPWILLSGQWCISTTIPGLECSIISKYISNYTPKKYNAVVGLNKHIFLILLNYNSYIYPLLYMQSIW